MRHQTPDASSMGLRHDRNPAPDTGTFQMVHGHSGNYLRKLHCIPRIVIFSMYDTAVGTQPNTPPHCTA